MTDAPKPASENNKGDDLVIRRGLASLFSIWLVPIIALAIAGWLAVQAIRDQGPTITIQFETAEGIEAGKTKVKYKDVIVGTVEAIQLNPDLSGVKLTVGMSAGSESYLSENSKFWVVRPRVTLKGISGLDTIVSGAFIEIDPGQPGASTSEFTGLEEPPQLTSSAEGREFILASRKLGSYSVGSPVYYRGFEAGEILGYSLSDDKQSITTRIFIKAPYDALVTVSSRFWDSSGINLSLTAEGMKLNASSLQSLVLGGIEFSTPVSLEDAAPAPDGHQFTLFGSEEDIEEAQYTEKQSFILYFEGSVRGLNVGAPVEFKGIRVGTVTDINLEIDRSTGDFFIPVLIQLEPQRIRFVDSSADVPSMTGGLKQQIEHGMRAQLKTGSFLTGQLFVDLVMEPDKPANYSKRNRYGFPEIPTIPTSLEEITTSITQLVEKIERLPIDQLSNSMLRTAEGVEQLVTSDDIQETVRTLNATLLEYRTLAENAQDLTQNLDQTVIPEAAGALADARATLAQTEKTIQSAQLMFGAANSMLADGSPLRYDLENMLRELSASARSIRNLSAYLERNPSALITGKTPQGVQP
ncbi:intermembrane transport protein PqiB [Aestuariispira insulae]|uniref:Paraquat-inducible protein B n=1 Tax=Aestuariispira insulae TaxID=1461337 RepID=A0A3D9HF36_9PROT|nr:MlaD family protein [Aestuariispira insulae]RED48099.1 paraquat-inducible protein B [Aestuariispira insulae]